MIFPPSALIPNDYMHLANIMIMLCELYMRFETFIADHKMSNASIIMLNDELVFHSIYHHNANCEKYIIFSTIHL